MIKTSSEMSYGSVHSLRDEQIEFKKIGESKMSPRHTSRSSSRQTHPRPSSVLEGLLTNLAQNVNQQGELMKTLSEQTTSVDTQQIILYFQVTVINIVKIKKSRRVFVCRSNGPRW